MTLSKLAILALRGLDVDGRMRVAELSGVKLSTLLRWIRTNHKLLTQAQVTDAISQVTGLPEGLIIETKVQQVAA